MKHANTKSYIYRMVALTLYLKDILSRNRGCILRNSQDKIDNLIRSIPGHINKCIAEYGN